MTMTDHEETLETASRALVLRPEPASIVQQTVATEVVVAAQAAYHELCSKLLDRSDYQTIGKKDFRKKSGWRKLAVAFNVSVELVSREYERDPNGRIIRAEVVARATAPNGRTMDGLGACDLYEKCCGQAYGEPCGNKSSYHKHCERGCSGRAHFSNPQHDLPATAHTRAVNRACADLFGMGEVSAEEITDNHRDYDDDRPTANDPIITEETAFELEVRVRALPEEAKKDLQARWSQPAALKDAAMTIPGLRRLTEPQAKLVESLLRGVENAAKKDGYDKTAATAAIRAQLAGDSEATGAPNPDPGTDGAAKPAETQDEAKAAETEQPDATPEPTEPEITPAAAKELEDAAGEQAVDEEIERVKKMKPAEVKAALEARGRPIEGAIDDLRKRLMVALLKERIAAKTAGE